tara:strand:+ start:4009 stop:4242 length:234 start_codon:yes stop_codon:yes gene_type:complete
MPSSIMSRIQKKVTDIVEPESFEEEVAAVPEYKPEHPALAAYQAAAVRTAKADHLDAYVEVDPFAKKEADAEAKEEE